MAIGILCPNEVRALNPEGMAPHRIRVEGRELDGLLGESAIDLPLGDRYWLMRGSCRTGGDIKVADLTRLFKKADESRLSGDLVLKKGCVYLFRVGCSLNLADTNIRGKGTARSSIGRLDVLVRLLCDRTSEFDRIPPGQDGELYVEVTPITFDIIVRQGMCLSQLRLFRGSDRLVSITKEEFEYEEMFPIVEGSTNNFATEDPHEVSYPFKLDLSPDPHGLSGLVAKSDHAGPIDPDKKNHYVAEDYWEPVLASDGAIELEPNRLYILRSKERLRLPGHIALECQAYTETMGEWRIEYAGFAHPFFGWKRSEGSPLMFEVRGHNVPTILTDGIPLGNVCFKRMSKPAEDPPAVSEYEQQELKLSGCFKDWKNG